MDRKVPRPVAVLGRGERVDELPGAVGDHGVTDQTTVTRRFKREGRGFNSGGLGQRRRIASASSTWIVAAVGTGGGSGGWRFHLSPARSGRSTPPSTSAVTVKLPGCLIGFDAELRPAPTACQPSG
jgi:hypothetical protein